MGKKTLDCVEKNKELLSEMEMLNVMGGGDVTDRSNTKCSQNSECNDNTNCSGNSSCYNNTNCQGNDKCHNLMPPIPPKEG